MRTVRTYGVYRRCRLLENTTKEISYTALRDKSEKEAILLEIDVFATGILQFVFSVLTRRGAM